MTDIVYVCRDGANPELRYSLRTLQNVHHERVWIFGGAPSWINQGTVRFQSRPQSGRGPYHATRNHIQAACNTPAVSDPFLLWNDDFYAMEHVGRVPVYHRGPVTALLEQYDKARIPWVIGLRETAALLQDQGLLDGAMSYDVHLPLLIHKAEMREALRLANKTQIRALHLRTLYGVIANLGGVEHLDPKMYRRSEPFPRGAWLSSSNDTFRPTVEPVLRYLFPEESIYERD